jgi:hypothetical protein
MQNYHIEKCRKYGMLGLCKVCVKFSLNLLTFELMFIIFAPET